MESIKEAANQNVTSTRQMESEARSLNELGLKLKATVGQYRVKETG